MRSFTAAKGDAKAKPIPIRIGDSRDPASEVFEIPRPLPTLSLLEVSDLGAKLDQVDDDPEMRARAGRAFVAFLRECVGEADWDRFWAACKRYRIGEGGLVEIAEHLIEEGTGRPIGAPASSPPSPSSDGSASRRRSSGRATKPRSRS